MRMNPLQWIAFILVVVGGLNWGLVGLFGYNLVDTLFGEGSTLAKIVYDLVGLAALVMIAGLFMKPKAASAPTAPLGQ